MADLPPPEPVPSALVRSLFAPTERPDHTSGVMRCDYLILGGHVHCKVFGPYSGKAGDLVFRVEEWEHFQRTTPGWSFHSEGASE